MQSTVMSFIQNKMCLKTELYFNFVKDSSTEDEC